MTLRWTGGLTIALALVSACGAQDRPTPAAQSEAAKPSDEEIKKAQAEADKIIQQQVAKVQQKEASTFPCSLFPQPDVESLAGNPLQPGSYAFNHVSDNDRQYRSETCDWSATGDGNEVSLWVSLPKHFDSGKVECSPGSANREIPGIGDRAWWEFQKYFGIGTLRICSAKAMLEVKVDLTSHDESAAKAIAQKMAERVLSSQ